MADIYMNTMDFPINNGSSDYVLNYLNFADFELNNSDKESSCSLFERRNTSHKQSMNFFNGCLLQDTQSIETNHKHEQSLCDIINSDNCLNMGVEMTNISTTVDKSEDLKMSSMNMLFDEKCQFEENKSTSIDSQVKSESIKDINSPMGESLSYQRKKKNNSVIKYIKRNCDLGVDSRADPDLKPSATNFVRTRGKPISKNKQKFLCYKMKDAKKFKSEKSDLSSEIPAFNSRKSKKSLSSSDDEGYSSSVSYKKETSIGLNVIDSLKKNGGNNNSMLLTFLSMKICNEHQFKGYYDNIKDLDENTRRIEQLRLLYSSKRTKAH